jgi:hypothetical protein
VVQDEIEDHAHALRMGGIDEPPQAVRAAVGVMRRPQEDAVVAPPPLARELRHRHQLDRIHAERPQPP